jgi:hypothetical protein
MAVHPGKVARTELVKVCVTALATFDAALALPTVQASGTPVALQRLEEFDVRTVVLRSEYETGSRVLSAPCGNFGAKKRRHERSSCSCREASDANHFQPRWQQTRPPPQLEYIHHSIDSEESKYNNRNFLNLIGQQFPKTAQSLNKAVAWRI